MPVISPDPQSFPGLSLCSEGPHLQARLIFFLWCAGRGGAQILRVDQHLQVVAAQLYGTLLVVPLPNHKYCSRITIIQMKLFYPLADCWFG